MLLLVEVAVNGDGGGGGSGGDGGGGGSGGDDGNDRNGRNSANWEVEQIKGTDSEGTMLAMVELRMRATCGRYLI
jgi:hypothetical protein